MKLASYRTDGRESYGIVVDGAIIDLATRLGDDAPTLQALITSGLDPAREIEASEAPDVALDDVQLLPPITRPGAIWCAGLNTHTHFAEVSALMGVPHLPEYPIMFLRATNTIVGSGDTIEKPALEPSFDYEGEIALVIGTRCRNVSVDEALGHVAGYTCFNDGSARQYQIRSSHGTAGKNAYRSGSCGPWLVTADDVSVDELSLETRVNGDVRQQMQLDDLIFSFAELIAYLSEFTWLEPGDVIATGSPEGNGVLRQPPGVLTEGDVVEVEVSGLGTLTNTVQEQQR